MCICGQHGVAGFVGGVDAPRGEALQFRGGGVGIAEGFALGDKLTGDRDVALLGGVVASAEGHHCAPSAGSFAVGLVAGVKEVVFDVAEWWVVGRVCAGAGGGLGGGIEQAAAVEVGRVPGVLGTFGRGVVEPGADDPVGVGLG